MRLKLHILATFRHVIWFLRNANGQTYIGRWNRSTNFQLNVQVWAQYELIWSQISFTVSWELILKSPKYAIPNALLYHYVYGLLQSCTCTLALTITLTLTLTLTLTQNPNLQSINQSCIFRVVQVLVIKSFRDPLEVGNNLPRINDNYRERGLEQKCF